MTLARAQAPSAAEQLKFADSLYQQGQDNLAELELRRLLFFHPTDPVVMPASVKLAEIYLAREGGVDRATSTLQSALRFARPSPEAQRLTQLLAFIQANSDLGGKPLQLFFAAKRDKRRQAYDAAQAKLLRLVNEWPKANLADDALYHAGKLFLDPMKRPPSARERLQLLLTRYPESELKESAEYYLAVAYEAENGPTQAAHERYHAFLRKYPGTRHAKAIKKRLAGSKAPAAVIKRTHDRRFVRPYRPEREGYERARPDEYFVAISISRKHLSAAERLATLEEALVAYAPKRGNPDHAVRVRAYDRYPRRSVGEVHWQPGQAPTYSLEKRRHGDEAADMIFDILEKR